MTEEEFAEWEKQEAALREEIARRAPDVRVVFVGPCLRLGANRFAVDAIVADHWGQQRLWSADAQKVQKT